MPEHRKYEKTGQISPGRNDWHGKQQFAKLTSINQSLVNGILVIEVTIWSHEGSDMQVFAPKNPFSANMLKLFMDEESADVVFQVGGQQGTADNKRAKTSPTNFHAHRLVLRQCAPQLLQMCDGARGEVPINDIKPEIFRHLLHYIYGGDVEEEDLEGDAKDILDAADRTGVVSLKMEAEACYVRSTRITVDNMVDELVYANSKTLALLKEAVMEFAAKNSGEVREKLSREDVPRDVRADLMETVNGGALGSYLSLSVCDLRERLEERGLLGIDGSKQAMINALRENDSSQENENDVEGE